MDLESYYTNDEGGREMSREMDYLIYPGQTLSKIGIAVDKILVRYKCRECTHRGEYSTCEPVAEKYEGGQVIASRQVNIGECGHEGCECSMGLIINQEIRK